MYRLRYKKNEFLFFVPYILLIIYRIVKSSTIQFNDKGLIYVVIMMLLCIKILSMKVKTNSFLAVCVLVPIFIFNIFKTWDPVIPVVFMILLASRDVPFRKIVYVSFVTNLVMLIAIVSLCCCGIIEDITSSRTLSSVTCHALGFSHSSKVPTHFFFLFFEYCYLKGNRIKKYSYVIFLIIGWIIFQFCAERLRFYNLIIAIVFMLFSRYFQVRFSKIKHIISIMIYPVLCFATNALGYFYNPQNNILYTLNILTSNRLYLEQYAFKNYGISLLGTNIYMGEEAVLINGKLEYFYIDSAYVYIFVIYGAILGSLILIAYMLGSYKAYKSNNIMLLIWFICMAVDSIIGNQLLSVWMCPLILFLFSKVDEDN